MVQKASCRHVSSTTSLTPRLSFLVLTEAPTFISLPTFPKKPPKEPPKTATSHTITPPVQHVPPTKPRPNGRRSIKEVHQEIFHQPPSVAQTPEEMDATIMETLDREETIPKFSPTREAMGKTMHPRSFALSHPAAPMLDSWGRQGCPADCGQPWSKQHITAALKRGPHVSALPPDAIASL